MNDEFSKKGNNDSFAFIFVCQEGQIEIMSVILAASLKYYLRCRNEIIAAIPMPKSKFGSPRESTLNALQQIGVKISYIFNDKDFKKKGDAVTNKILCFGIPTDMEKIIFIDSDMICLKEFYPEKRFTDYTFNAKPGDDDNAYLSKNEWEKVYQIVETKMPEVRIKTTVTQKTMPLYFNAGFIGISKDWALKLKNEWLNCFMRIDKSRILDNNSFFRDQVSLPAAVIKLGLDYDLLDETYNYPLYARGFLEKNNLPYFCHHRRGVKRLLIEPAVRDLMRALVEKFPLIVPCLEHSEWKSLIKPNYFRIGILTAQKKIKLFLRRFSIYNSFVYRLFRR